MLNNFLTIYFLPFAASFLTFAQNTNLLKNKQINVFERFNVLNISILAFFVKTPKKYGKKTIKRFN